VLAGCFCLGWALTSRGVTLFDYHLPISAFDDILVNPNDHLSWSINNITYSFDASFNNLFPANGVNAIQSQVELALATWAAASTTPYGTVYSYQRLNNAVYGSFADIRTITLHEIGHALGLGHPNMGAALNLNFVPSPDGGPGCGNLQVAPSTGQEVMYAFVQSGEYNHILAWDELDAYCDVYGARALTFTKVANGGDIVFTTWNGPPNNFAVTDPVGTQGSVAAGSIVTSATISFNVTPPIPVGTSGHLINWTITNPGLSTHTVQIQTHGTQNTTPVAFWNNDGQGVGGDNRYVFGAANGSTPPTATLVGPNAKDDLTWRWSPPATDIPAGTPFHPGLGLDVDDWTVINCVCFDMNFNVAVVPVTVADQFSVGMFATAGLRRDLPFYAQGAPPQTDSYSAGEADKDASTYLPSGSNTVFSSGFSIIASQTPQTTISALKYADVTGMGLSLSNLNGYGLAQLQSNNLVTAVTNFGVHTLGSGQRFVVLLQGGSEGLPPDVLTNGNFLIMNRPDLLTKELFLAWTSTNSQCSVENFAFVGEPPMATAPTLTIHLRGQGQSTNGVLLTWPAPSYGFVLQQNTNLETTNWVNVTITPTVVTGQNQVIVSPANGTVFYRLKNP